MKKLQTSIHKFLDERDWLKRGSPVNYAKSISIEAAELLELFQWTNLSTKEVLKNKALLAEVKKELADVFVYCLDLATLLDLDAEQVIKEKMAYNAKKYPAKVVRGGMKNYYKIKKQYRLERS